ncbi:DUF4181 domain-containing protein [Pseudalkalibacillus caeni]|uniref:DUF4181 domain-containing protein n=2 Tax=Exobacillus caeni TaxID=2574798 RepID=A0A5R9F0S2_9BACL|nr:DUF4181 domain-containing protein [Pseudalkalibacillus caeni]
MRKWLKVDKKKLFSYNHVNEKHKKVDWTIRITFLIVLLFGFFLALINISNGRAWIWEPSFVLFIYIIVSETARAIMEWKYATNRKAYILTVSQLGFTVIIILSVFFTNFFGLLRY